MLQSKPQDKPNNVSSPTENLTARLKKSHQQSQSSGRSKRLFQTYLGLTPDTQNSAYITPDKQKQKREEKERKREQYLARKRAMQSEETKADKAREARKEKWLDQATARRLLPKEAVAECLHCMIPMRQEAMILETPTKNGKSRFYTGLKVCKSVWMCANCAAKITERRRQELEQGIKKWCDELGLHVYMATYTFAHYLRDVLKENLKKFNKARHNVKSGDWAKKFKAVHKIAGYVDVLEVTYGHRSNGYHPHVHELIFTTEPLDLEVFEAELRTKWEHEAAKQGLKMNEHGFHITETRGAIADYIAKWGHEPKDPTHVWGAEAEMTKGHLKRGHCTSIEDVHMTMFQVLRAIRVDSRKELEPVFIEYAMAFKGHQQLRYSPGLQKLLGIEKKTDEELAEEQTERATPILAIAKPAWNIVIGNDFKAELLELPNAEDMRRALIQLGCYPEHIRVLTIEQAPPGAETEEQKAPPPPPCLLPSPVRTEEHGPQLLAKELAMWHVEYKSFMECQHCDCKLFRPTPWGTWVCCNCNPHNLWSDAMRATIATFYPRTKIDKTGN